MRYAQFSYALSPVQIIVAEQRRAWYHFVTTTCAVVGGVFTVAGILDGIFHTSVCLKSALACLYTQTAYNRQCGDTVVQCKFGQCIDTSVHSTQYCACLLVYYLLLLRWWCGSASHGLVIKDPRKPLCVHVNLAQGGVAG